MFNVPTGSCGISKSEQHNAFLQKGKQGALSSTAPPQKANQNKKTGSALRMKNQLDVILMSMVF